jgi:hypothetical protein
MTNKRNTEMAKKGAVLGLFALLVIIIGIALAVYFSTKKSGEETPDKPEITLDAASKNLNPRGDGTDEDATVDTSEGYKIEYATGDDSGNESIDLKITWTTGMGFDAVSKLIFRREIGGNKVQEDIVYDSGSGIENNSNGEITFKGTELTDSSKSVVGANKVSVWYNSVSDDTFLVDTGDQIKIEQSDIDTTLNLTEVQEVAIPITIASDSFKFEILGKETLYLIEEFHLCFKMKNLDGGKVQFINLITGNADKLWDNTDAYRLKKYKDGYMLGHPDNNRKEVLVRKVLTKDDIDFGDGKFINHKPTFKKLNEMNKDEYARALFHLEPVRTAIHSDQNEGKMVPGTDYKSPSDTFRFKQTSDKVALALYDVNRKIDLWKSAFPPDFNKPCDTARIGADGNFFMKVTGTESFGYRSETHEWGSGNGPFRVVVGDNGTIAILKNDGLVIHYIFRVKPISIIMDGDATPHRYRWTKPDGAWLSDKSLFYIRDRWIDKDNLTIESYTDAKKAGFNWAAFTLADGDSSQPYVTFGQHAPYAKGFIHLPDGACDIMSSTGILSGTKNNNTWTGSSYVGPEHIKLPGYVTHKVYHLPTLDLSVLGGNMTKYSINSSHNIYMERQTLDCKDHAMRGFQLKPNWYCENDDVCKQQVSSADLNGTDIKHEGKGTAIRYNYFCNDKKETSVTSKETSWVTNPGLSKTYAYGQNDTFNVNCDKKPITYYKLVTDQNNNWRLKYDYKCGNTTSNKCRSITTEESDASNNPGFLDRQIVKCEDNEYLSQFKLKSTGVEGKNKYEYTCCK